MGNAPRVGRAAHTTKPDLWYFDQLPPSARQALAEAAFSWSSGAVLNRWKRGSKGYKTGKEIAARVSEWDKKVIAKERR